MKLIPVILSISFFTLSCAQEKEEIVPKEPIKASRILIGSVETDDSHARFYEVNDPKIVDKYFEIFVDTVKWNAISFTEYDHMIYFFQGDEIVEEIRVRHRSSSYSFSGSTKIQSGIVRNGYWKDLEPHMKELEHECYIFPNSEMAEEFYQLAKSKEAFVSAPYFCPWRKFDGELFVRTNISGDPITTDSMRSIISEQYPEDIFEVEPADHNFEFSSPRDHERFKITCSYEFFEKFKFRGRNFEEIESTDFDHKGENYLLKGRYIPFMLRVPPPPPPVDIKVKKNRSVAPIFEFKELSEHFVKFAPVIEFVGSKEVKKEMDEWMKQQ